jgi:hypothetical protein
MGLKFKAMSYPKKSAQVMRGNWVLLNCFVHGELCPTFDRDFSGTGHKNTRSCMFLIQTMSKMPDPMKKPICRKHH